MVKDKLVVITAAASGMGRAGVEIFSKFGARVVAVDRDEKALAEVVEGVNAAGGRASALPADLLDVQGSRQVIHDAAKKMGGIDIVWAHAGCPGPEGIEGLDLEAYERTMNLNLRTGVLSVAEAVPYMRERGGGAVVFTASTAGVVGANLSPLYSAAKHSVIGLAKSLGLSYAPEKIRVNAVCPGPIETPMLSQFTTSKRGADFSAANAKRLQDAVPLGRHGKPEEVAHAAMWLASDYASFVTGTYLLVDGGYTSR